MYFAFEKFRFLAIALFGCRKPKLFHFRERFAGNFYLQRSARISIVFNQLLTA